jgi:hypothetical protein
LAPDRSYHSSYHSSYQSLVEHGGTSRAVETR